MLGILVHMWIQGKNGHQVKFSSLLGQCLIKYSQRRGPLLEGMLITFAKVGKRHWMFLKGSTRIRAFWRVVEGMRQHEGLKLQHQKACYRTANHSTLRECRRTTHQSPLLRTVNRQEQHLGYTSIIQRGLGSYQSRLHFSGQSASTIGRSSTCST